jgi:hypothetical protein
MRTYKLRPAIVPVTTPLACIALQSQPVVLLTAAATATVVLGAADHTLIARSSIASCSMHHITRRAVVLLHLACRVLQQRMLLDAKMEMKQKRAQLLDSMQQMPDYSLQVRTASITHTKLHFLAIAVGQCPCMHAILYPLCSHTALHGHLPMRHEGGGGQEQSGARQDLQWAAAGPGKHLTACICPWWQWFQQGLHAVTCLASWVREVEITRMVCALT